jgi:hypothetical protein
MLNVKARSSNEVKIGNEEERVLAWMWCLRPFLPQRRNEDGGKGEEDYPPKDLQRVDGSFDERERKGVIKGVMKYWNDGKMGLNKDS